MVVAIFLGNFGGEELVFMSKFWWKVVMWAYRRERERERERERKEKGKIRVRFGQNGQIAIKS